MTISNPDLDWQDRQHDNETDVEYAQRLIVSARAAVEQARRIAGTASDDAARRLLNEREGAPIVTIGLDTPIDRIPRYSGDPDDPEPEPAQTIRDVIVERAAQMLAHSEKGIRADVRARVLDMVNETLQARVEELITDTLTNPIRQTNTWGEPTGEPTTLRALVVKEAHDWLLRQPSRDPYGDRRDSDARKACARVLVKDLVESVMTRELTKEVETAKAMVKERVQVTTSAVIAKAVTDGLQLGR